MPEYDAIYLCKAAVETTKSTDARRRRQGAGRGVLRDIITPAALPYAVVAGLLGAIFAIELASSTAYHDVSLRAGRTPHYQPDVRSLVEIGRFVSAPDYLKAEQYRAVLMEEFKRVFERVDVVVGPTTPITAWKIGEWTVEVGGKPESVLAASWRFTYPYNLTGLPAISVPCGFDRAGLPIGLQIAGRLFDEMAVLRVAHAYEQSHDWKDRRPTL